MQHQALGSARTCPDCEQPISPAAPEGLCPGCLVRSSCSKLLLPSPGVENFAGQRSFGDYELLEEFGRGGCGVVFKARQYGLNRTVALKLLASGPASSRDFVHRFHTEAAAAAHLEHPNIVPIYEFGEHEGAYFLAMRFLEGGTLAMRISRSRPTPAEAARCLLALAHALEHAHRSGILHRDLKPGNVLLDSAGNPFLCDFGLARILNEDSALTVTHSILGTVAYLPPEIAARGAGAATTASDIYGLGGILYELLTGQPPFQKGTPPATLRAIAEEPPVPPRELAPETPLDLQTICLKCLEKDPAKRYSSAQDLGDDLGRFLKNEPIAARPTARTERLFRWAQRNPALAIANAVLFLLLVVILVGSPLAIYRIKTEAEHARGETLRAKRNSYAADMRSTEAAVTEGNLLTAFELLKRHEPKPGETDQRGWEWRYYQAQTKGEQIAVVGRHEQGYVTAVGFLADGKRAWSAGEDKTIRIWDIATGKELDRFEQEAQIYDAALSPDGKTLTMILGRAYWPGNYPVKSLDLSRREPAALLATSYFPRQTILYSPDGRYVAFQEVSDGLRVFETDTKQETRFKTFRDKRSPLGFAFGPDLMAYAYDRSGSIRLYSLSAKTNIATLEGHSDVVESLAFSPDGRRLASASLDHSFRFWDVQTHQEILNLPNPNRDVWPIVFSPAGDVYATIDSQLRLWDSKTGTVTREFRGHIGSVNNVKFSPDGSRLLSCGTDGTLRLWETHPTAVQGNSLALPKDLLLTGNRGQLFSLSPNGQHLITVFKDGTFSVWNTTNFHQSKRYSLGTSNINQEAIAANGRLAAFVTQGSLSNRELLLFDIDQEREVGRKNLLPMDGRIAFSPDTQSIAVGSWPSVQVFNLKTLQETHSLNCSEPTVAKDLLHGLTFSADSKKVAGVGSIGAVYVWDLSISNSREIFRLSDCVLKSVAFAPNDSSLFAGGWGPDCNGLFDMATHRPLPQLTPNPGGVLAIAYSPDGTTLALSGGDTISLRNCQSYELTGHLRGHRQEIFELAFLPDNRSLVSVSYDELRLWQASDDKGRESIRR